MGMTKSGVMLSRKPGASKTKKIVLTLVIVAFPFLVSGRWKTRPSR